MTREEQIIKASHLYAKAQQKPFMDGALWADKNPRVSLWDRDKVIDFLEYNLDDCKIIEDLIRAMGLNREKLNEMVANAPDRRLEREKKKWVEKAVKWLVENFEVEKYNDWIDVDGRPLFNYKRFEDDFKKAMEEQQ